MKGVTNMSQTRVIHFASIILRLFINLHIKPRYAVLVSDEIQRITVTGSSLQC